MANRPIRRPLGLELLESRVYLSAPSGHPDALRMTWSSAVAALNDRLTAANIGRADASSLILVVDLNAIADSSDALLATFDASTGNLLSSVPVSRGQLLLVTEPLAWTQTTSTGATPPTPGETGASMANDDGIAPEPPAPPTIRRPRLVVIFPSGTIPESFSPPVGANHEPSAPADERVERATPLILLPGFPRWITMLSPSPWWARATSLSGIQSRVGDLMNQRWDDTIGETSRQVADDFSYGSSTPLDFASSRIRLHTPVRSIVFTIPRAATGTSAQPGAELAVYNLESGQLHRTGHAVSGRLVRAGNQVAFLSPEWEQQADLTGDGVLNALVLQVFNPVTGGVRNTGIAAEAVRADDDQIILGIRGAAPPSPYGAEQNGGHLTAYRYDPRTGRLVDMQTQFSSKAAATVAGGGAAPGAMGTAERLATLRPNSELIGPAAVSPVFGAVHMMAPIDSSTSPQATVASEVSARPASGSPSGPPKPGGSTGSASGPVSASSASSAGSQAGGASGAGTAGGGGE